MKSRKITTFIFFFLICSVITLFHYLGWLNSIEVFLRRVTAPGTQALYRLGTELQQEVPDSYEGLLVAYRTLEQQYTKEKVDTVELNLLRGENEALRNQLSFFKNTNVSYVSANVVGENIDPVGRNLVIDAGQSSGVTSGDPVVAGGGALIGRITDVYERTSYVRLLDDSQSKFAALIQNEEQSKGVVEGGYGLSIRMNFIPQNEVIAIGETVVTSGLEDRVPRGLVIGTIEAFEKEPYEPFQSAIITPMQNLGDIFFVSVITSS